MKNMIQFRVYILWIAMILITDWAALDAYLPESSDIKIRKVGSGLGEDNGTPLQYSCLENPMDGGAWWAAVHGVAKSQTRLSDFTFTFHFHALEKEMAPHSSVLAWRIPGTGEPGGLPSMGLQSRTWLKRFSSSSSSSSVYIQSYSPSSSHPTLPSLCLRLFSVSGSLFLPCR